IATATTEQSQGITQVNTAMTQMDKVTQSNAASAEESASASEELNAQAETLKATVADLNRLVGIDVADRKFGHNSPGLFHPAQNGGRPAKSRSPHAAVAGERSAETLGTSFSGRRKEDLIPMDGSFKDF
ncbi:MAG TPA: methyl-accepting chemotaxis protein, partial [Verrucomicrobiae bacterium]|nr:methyl-accepting chemotaxis protein [Verrucomicrobiae bacterium]